MSEYFHIACEGHRVEGPLVASRGFFDWRNFDSDTVAIGDFIDRHNEKTCKLVVVSEHYGYGAI